MYLTTTTARVRASVAGSAGIHCTANWIDFEAGQPFEPGSTNTILANNATTDLVGSPAAGKVRRVRNFMLRNTHGSDIGSVTIINTDGTTAVQPYSAVLAPGATLQYVDELGFAQQNRLVSTDPNFANKIIGTAIIDPSVQLRNMQLAGNIAATPTNITVSIARCSLFIPRVGLEVNRLRWYGVGSTTNVYRVAIYRLSDLARITAETPIVTTADVFNETPLTVTLAAGVPYFLACSVNATGTVAGVGCVGGTVAATTGRIAVAPSAMPGFLFPGNALEEYKFQFAVTTGALPATAPTLAAQAAWAGGMPAFWLDNSTAGIGGPIEVPAI